MKNILFIAINKLIYHFRVDLGDGNGDDFTGRGWTTCEL